MPTFHVAIVGAGPAGYFTAQALQNSQTPELTFAIDLIERLPTPWGLVRSGVAPDHPKIKTVAKVFEKVASESGFTLFANVELGIDVSLETLLSNYDAVVMCTGSSIGKKLGIPGEDLPGSLSAAQFVPWYNGHPDFSELKPDFTNEIAVVIGGGNVAMDVARLLALDPSELESTDIAQHALEPLRSSKINKVIICARRGPEHAAFTAPELRDLVKLEHTDVTVNADDISAARSRAEITGEVEKEVRQNLDAFQLVAEHPTSGHPRNLEIKFFATPLEILGKERVEEVVFGVNTMRDGKVVDSGERFSIKCGLVVSAIGYEAAPIPGVAMSNGRIINVEGRTSTPGLYTVGWAKRGPSGVIGTNKSDASDVVKLLIADLKQPKSHQSLETLLPAGCIVVNQERWQTINQAEISRGEAVGKPREKFTDIPSMLDVKLA